MFFKICFSLLQVICRTGRWSQCGRSWGGWERGIWCDCTVASSWKETTGAASTSLSTDRRRTRSSFPEWRPCQLIRCGPCWDTLLRSVHCAVLWWAARTRGTSWKRGLNEPEDQQGAVVLYDFLTQFAVVPFKVWELEKKTQVWFRLKTAEHDSNSTVIWKQLWLFLMKLSG